MHWYSLLITIHVTCVALSLGLFALRGGAMLAERDWRHARVLRFAPHIVDTILLTSALGLVALIQQYPFVDAWLTAKVCALIAYIGLGTIALKRGRTKCVRLWAGLAALAVFAYIVSVALTHSASGVLLWL